MTGVGFSSRSPLPLVHPLLPQTPLFKRLWCRFRMSAHTASPPPRLLLVVLLAAQILVLAIIRLGPSSVPPAASPRRSVPLFVGSASQIPLRFLPAENKDSPSLPAQETRHSLLQESKNASLHASQASDELPDSVSMLDSSSPGNDDESRSETRISDGDESPAADKELLPQKTVLTTSDDASLTREGKSLEEAVALKVVDDLLPSVDEATIVTANSQVSPTAEGKTLEEVVRPKAGYDLLPSVEDSFLSQELATDKDERHTADEKFTGNSSPSTNGESPHKTVEGDDLLPSFEEPFRSDGSESATATATVEDRSAVVDAAASGKDERWAIVKEENTDRLAHLEASPSLKEEKSDNETSGSTDRVEEEKSDTVEEAAAEESTVDDSSPSVKEKSDSKMASSADLLAENPQNAFAVSTDRSKEQPFIAEKVNPMVSSECQFGYIYMYNLPAEFNHDIVADCSALNPWTDVCSTLANGGLGESLGDASPLGQTGSWFFTDQFTAEIVFHNRMLQHPCLTDQPELASGFYVPFYAGLEVGRYLFHGSPAERRDRVSKQLLEWLDGQEYWKRSGGWNHFMMIGRITWDFRRSKDEDWGSSFFYNPPMLNTTRLLIERNPWDEQEMAVPYPTNFHPQSDADLRAWQDHLRGLKRSYLFSFAGARRSDFPNDFRAILLSQCEKAQRCKSLDCSAQTCGNSQKSLELFMNSTFCLQPRGDSFTRRSTFDCMLAGSIPVFFWHRSAYWQYKWHLPSDDESSYSVFIRKEDMRNGTNIEQVLAALSPEKVGAMQEAVIKMIPRIVYATTGFSLKEETDAFDVAIEGVQRRFKQLRVN